MKTLCVLFLVCNLAHAAEVTPVQKVIELLEGMATKGKDEMHKEQVQFAAYKQWCVDTDAAKGEEIAELAENIERLNARIEKAATTIDDLTRSIEENTNDHTRWTLDLKAEIAVRAIQKKDFDALNKDYSESIDALTRAIQVLKEHAKDTAQGALVQVTNSPLISDDIKKSLSTFLAQEDDDQAPTPPEANAYEFQSGGIIAMLEKLLDKFINEQTQLQKEEKNAQHEFDMQEQSLNSNIDNADNLIGKQKEEKTETQQQKADDEGQVEEDTTQKEAAETYKAEVAAECNAKAGDFEARQKLRGEELEAIAKAVEILESDDVSGAADKHLPAAFAQLRSDSRSPAQSRAAAYLQAQAKELNSRVLSAVAEHVADDPFAKVKKMINDLIVKLMDEATEEAEHKGWCDTELATNGQTRKDKTASVEKLTATIDQLNAEITKLGEDLANLAKTISEATETLATADAARDEEKATNKETVEDGKAALAAVGRALGVLKDFYAKASKATALVQQPEIFDAPYTGLGGQAGGVVGMMEVIESDFQRLVDETEAAEEENANNFRTLKEDTAKLIAVSKTDQEHKTADKASKEGTLEETKTDLEQTQKQLFTANNYYDKLKPSCVNEGVNYADRVEQRNQEIQSLKEALEILEQFGADA